ncbi:Serine/threonine-protein kinase [Knufia obscura]|uniref:non-specific serine/threonine protein kinase n=1 Tax=Knufia obscura TaxID=1635080 RepID=A0ABR0S5F5_9EURO|nr:Serine/threonine-protein kinase [Knufia obscura]
MGQGYSMTTLSAASATIDVPELSDLTQDKTLASARFMKSMRARSQQGFVYVKAVMKPYSSFDVRDYVRQIRDERNTLAGIPNALGYQRIVEVGSAGFLVRQYIYSSVYDRLSTRPFLEDIEKRWLSYQLLCAVRDCHARNLYHGDIKTENLLVTSWNWLYLSDFSSSFKPTTLPEDNPADFSFYFDTSARRVCYIAPERFTSGSTDEAPQELNWAMDMFSVGCAIAEMFLEGPIFSLSQIFKYKSGEYSPEHAHIEKIDDPEVRAMVLNMIDLDPEKRYSAEQNLSFYKTKIFPEYFYSFLHDYMQDLTEPVSSGTQLVLDSEILFESDRKVEKVFHDLDKIAYFLGYSEHITDAEKEGATGLQKTASGISDIHIDNALHDGTLLFLALVSSAIRNTSKASARLKACDMLTSFAHRLPDEAKLDRILPYVVGMLSDKSDAVRVAALHATTSILDSVRVVSPVNAYLFPEYIFPRLRQFLSVEKSQPSALIRAAYASCLASLALASGRMLDMVQAIRADGRVPALSNEILGLESSFHGLYDVARAELIPHFEESTTMLITDTETSVRRALLGSISRLCLFFGSSKSSDVILSHLNTYLNEPDWILRCAFYDALVGVATYVGTSSLEQFIVPIMIGSMVDPEHFVVEKVIRCFARMAALGLFQRALLWDLTGLVSRYLVHPSSWIREAAAQFIEQACQFLSAADRYCIMLPILQPFLRAPLLDFSEDSILDKLKSPISRAIFEAAVLWASKRERSLFWTAAGRDGAFTVAQSDTSFVTSNFTKRFPNRIPPSQKDKDDQQSLETLRNFGMVPDDEVKLMALREYILKYSQRKTEALPDDTQRMLGNIVSLAQLEVTPQNVFFDTVQPYRPARTRPASPRPVGTGNARSIADALMDASVSIGPATQAQPTSSNVKGGPSQPQSVPSDGKNTRSPSGEQTPAGFRAGSVDRPNIRIEGVKEESAKRASSVSGRHALLDTDRLSAERRDSKNLKHRNSSFNLLSRAETIKADAEISTTQENAFGKLDRSPTDKLGGHDSALTQSLNATEKSRSKSPMSQRSSRAPFEANHTYTGNEPAVIRLLDSHVADNFPIDLLDFGAAKKSSDIEVAIKSATTPNQQPSQAITHAANGNKEPWRPAGLLLAQFVEHTAAINRVVAAPDHAFFVTASDDGTCKIWDTSRLEKNVSARSRYTHRHSPGARVKSLCFIEDTHAFVSGATDGSIHVVRVDVKAAEGNDPTRFSKPVLVRDWQIPQQPTEAHRPPNVVNSNDDNHEHAVCMHHYRDQSSQSVLLVATDMCRILMVDMKNMELIRVMHNPLHHGTPTTFCVDRKHHWMMLGTSHGILDLWDLRFKLRLRSFGIGGAGIGQRVDKLLLHPSRGHGKWVVASCGGEISIWDIEKLTCREVLRPSSFKYDTSRKIKNYEPWHPDEESGENMLKRFASQIEVDDTLLQPQPLINQEQPQSQSDESKTPASASPPTQTPTITTLHIFTDYLSNPSQPTNPQKTTLMLSAGTDRTLRHWNLTHIEQSSIISGPMLNVVGEGDTRIKPRYETSWPTSMSLSGLVQLVEEKLSDAASDDPSKAAPRKKRDAGKSSDKQAQGHAGGLVKTPRNTIISMAQEQMLKTHMDDVSDVCLLRRPYGCVVSVDRGGAVFVFH